MFPSSSARTCNPMTVRLSTALVQSSRQYPLHTHPQASILDALHFLSGQEPRLSATTLEYVQPVQFGQQIQEIDLQAGDRLLIFLQAAHTVELPPLLKPGDRTLRIYSAGREIRSTGKRSLLLGWQDTGQQTTPDIDLGQFIARDRLPLIAPQAVWFNFDERAQVWYASRVGHTRVLLDELELGTAQVALSAAHRLRLYARGNGPGSISSQLLGELHVQVETVGSAAQQGPQLPPGSFGLPVRTGLERESQLINASENITFGQIARSLAQYNGLSIGPASKTCLARLLSPQSEVGSFDLSSGAFLYAPL